MINEPVVDRLVEKLGTPEEPASRYALCVVVAKRDFHKPSPPKKIKNGFSLSIPKSADLSSMGGKKARAHPECGAFNREFHARTHRFDARVV